MLSKLLMVFRIPELRQRILLTLLLLAVYRLGFSIPLPFVDQERLAEALQNLGGQSGGANRVMAMLALFSASSIGMSTIFGLGIMPYISASIIFQLLATVYPPLEQLQKEGEAGRKKINEYTRYATVVICLGQSFFWIRSLAGDNNMLGSGGSLILADYNNLYFHIVCTVTMTAGTILLMWIGEQIDEYGIGNGVSLLIMAGILARMPEAFSTLLGPAFQEGVKLGSQTGIERYLVLGILFIAVVFGVVLITQAQRRILVQSAKHVRGHRVFGGQRQYLPLRLNQSGVMPIIFASSLLMFPWFILRQITPIMMNWPVIGPLVDALDRTFQNPRLFLPDVLHRADLLLLLLLDGNHVQPQGHGQQPEGLRQLHPRLSAGRSHCGVSGKGDGPHHLRGGRIPLAGGDHPEHHHRGDGNRLPGGEFLWRHGLAHLRLSGARPGPEDRQPSGDAELPRFAGGGRGESELKYQHETQARSASEGSGPTP